MKFSNFRHTIVGADLVSALPWHTADWGRHKVCPYGAYRI